MANRKLSLFPTGDHPKLNLTAEEKRIFGALFKQADTKDGGVVTGEVAIALFPRAKLPEEILGQVCCLDGMPWGIAALNYG
jgi:epidermal growth factor receptor substrate 15